MPTWPVSLPSAPLVSGWQETLADNLYRFNPRQGRPLTRLKSTQSLDVQGVSWMLTAAQRTTFLTFYRTTLLNGLYSFDMAHPADGTVMTFQFTGSPPSWSTPDGGQHYQVSAQLMRVS